LFTSTRLLCFTICSCEPIHTELSGIPRFVTMSLIFTSDTCTGPSSLGSSFFAAFFLSLAAFSALYASSLSLACISCSFSGRMKVSMTQMGPSFLSWGMDLKDSI
jgi:hypothetical protein